MLNSIKLGFIVLLTLFTSLNVQAAGGIALGATRVIYPSAAKQTSLAISNSDTQERYLVNSWIENKRRAERKNVYRYAAFIRQRAQKRKHAAYYLRRATATRGSGVVILDERESHPVGR